MTGRKIAIFASGLIVMLAALAGIYVMGAGPRNAATGACADAPAEAKRLSPLIKGEIAALTPAQKPLALADIAFMDGDGKARTLAEWNGRVVLFNLWATWCVPCRKEMPALEALQKELGGAAFEVVTVNIDTRDPQKPRAWLRENGIERLAYYTDASAKVFQDLKAKGRAFGMPTTVLLDRAGCELASLAGPAEWASADALALIRAAITPTR